jgi:hypothetical protein
LQAAAIALAVGTWMTKQVLYSNSDNAQTGGIPVGIPLTLLMKRPFLSVVLLVFLFIHPVLSQEQSKNGADSLHHFHLSLSYQNRILGLTYNEHDKNLYLLYGFNPRISYFLTKRLSVTLSYIGIKSVFSRYTQYNAFYNNAELDLNYILARKRTYLFYTEAGYRYGEYRPFYDVTLLYRKKPGSMIRAGAGFMWFLNSRRNLGLNLDFNIEFNLNKPYAIYMRPYSSFSFGLKYFLYKKPSFL